MPGLYCITYNTLHKLASRTHQARPVKPSRMPLDNRAGAASAAGKTRKQYLKLYNGLSCLTWLSVTVATLTVLLQERENAPKLAYSRISTLLSFTQTGAILEVGFKSDTTLPAAQYGNWTVVVLQIIHILLGRLVAWQSLKMYNL